VTSVRSVRLQADWVLKDYLPTPTPENVPIPKNVPTPKTRYGVTVSVEKPVCPVDVVTSTLTFRLPDPVGY
jgi:hypothetical protein